ncbi:MAG: His/Gly/Thr/Pro-type tRNA ligase C-terminal domain-containing protein [bacterium]|nr:His/Gly/Thr/Pro-type tRNA ligase C-terminal domain-containing protein [bacterium]
MAEQISERIAGLLREFDRPLSIAVHYGFTPIESPKLAEKDFEMTRDCGDHPHYNAADKAAFIRTYVERGFNAMPHPLALAYKMPRVDRKHRGYTLELVGYSPGVAEAILIRTALSILTEESHKQLSVDVNCVGDKESLNAYERELHNFLKTAGMELPPEIKKELAKDVFKIMHHQEPLVEGLRQMAPPSIAHLSASSRVYFKEVLEYIEALNIEFSLTPELVGNKNYCSHTIFSIKNEGEAKVLAVGYSYPQLSRRFGFKKELSLTGISIFVEALPSKATGKAPPKALPKPKFYLVQLGREAKMRSLPIIELLRRERIPVYHYLGKDKITSQLATAESLSVPYLIIIGQKEALDRTATIRNTSTRAQETVSLADLPHFLKHIPI